MWYMLGIFIVTICGLCYLIDQWADEKFNPEKEYEHEAKR